jgi:phosphomannomutase/phosphoglucomutase
MKFSLDIKSFKPNGVLAWVALALLLCSAWQLWAAWDIFAARRLAMTASHARAHVADVLQPLLTTRLQQANALAKQLALIDALERNDMDGATGIVRAQMAGAEFVELHAPDLEAGYANAKFFGYGKLGLLERAALNRKATLAVVKDAMRPRLAVAVPIYDGGRLLALAYAYFPAAAMHDVVKGSVPDDAYLAIRQGNYDIAEFGNKEELQFQAEAHAQVIPGTPLKVVAAAPAPEPGMFNAGGWGELILAVLLAAAAAAPLWWPRLAPIVHRRVLRRVLAAPVVQTEELTLSQMQSSGLIVAPTKAAPLKVTSEGPAAPAIALDRSIFRAYDIRGVVGVTLDGNVARLIGQAIGSLMQERGQRTIAVCRDGRLSSPAMSGALIEGLRKAGREVIDIGEAPTPMAYFAAFYLRTGCCVSVTGSHNPPDYNGFKIVVDGETLAGEAIQNLYARIAENRLLKSDAPGLLTQRDIKADYISRISGDIQIERKLKVVIDCGSGVAGGIAPELLAAIGAEVEPLYCEVDGTFPHHHPDPSEPENLQDLISVVQRVGADIGLALDGDGDRLGVVTKHGEIIYPDRLLMLFATDVLERNPGACVIYDVKCTGHLATHILRHGGSPLMWKTGHSLIKAKMKETEAELAGEMSGHFFFRERWYGFDDGLYAACRLLEILAASPDDPEALFAELPKGVSTPEIKVPVEEGEQYRLVAEFVAKAKFDGARIATIDGLRADWPDGWGLVRASNTTPVLVMRFDAKDAESLARIQAAFRAQLMLIAPNLSLPF